MLWFSSKNKQIDNFAKQLADEIYSHIPPTLLEGDDKSAQKKLSRRFDKELQNAVTELHNYRLMYKLGVYGKARFHLTFMERLRNHGYPEALVKEINEQLMLKVP
jgi:site-specific recombinase